tara:strand:- start:29 stop:223 length:195 start_codon:yes stop_codon:yes gene_type:complete
MKNFDTIPLVGFDAERKLVEIFDTLEKELEDAIGSSEDAIRQSYIPMGLAHKLFAKKVYGVKSV